MTLENALDHMHKCFLNDPMKLVQFEDDMRAYYNKVLNKYKENHVEIGTVEVQAADPMHPMYRYVFHLPIVYATDWYTQEALCFYAAMVYYIHNDLEAFREFYDYPEEEAKEIIKNGFKD